MRLTRYTHACARFDDGDRTLVVDPGVFSEVAAALDGADAVLITHEHIDHLDVAALKDALGRDPRLAVWAPEPVAAGLAEFGEQVTTSAPGQAFDAAGFGVRTFGGQHAVIHPTIPVIPNVGYLIDDAVFHPGDALVVPPVEVAYLLAPLHAPWSKTSEVIDFVVGVRAARVSGIHDGLLTDPGRQLVEDHISRIAAPFGITYTAIPPAESVDV